MKEIKLPPEHISEILIKNLPDKNCIFIFSTDTVMNSWIEYLITHPELSNTEAIPLERFIAWDNFKGKYLRAEESGKSTIPSILKKLFVLDLISKNAAKPKEERFQVIINPDDEYAAGATSFAEWICSNLPSLHFWKKRMEENKTDYGEPDAEDKDYLKLYEEYKSFLDANNLYEPSWVENLDLGDKNTKFILFYPELLKDYGEFAEIFAKCENITITTMPENIPNPKFYLYTDSRTELRQTMLRIIDLVNSGKADWSEIALSIPDLDTYRPYIEREFGLYEIPYVIKAGISLTKNSAGRIFKEINDCHSQNFTFDTIRSLLLDECVPWKPEHKEKREGLVRVGNEMRCICSPTEKDIWFSALKRKINHLENDEEQKAYYSQLEDFYGKIKHYVEAFYVENATFASIATAWNGFKSYFLESNEKFSKTANDILGRCITNLKEIISIEEQFSQCNLHISNPFEFFLRELDNTKYTPQQKDKTGVNIFSYKLSGPAYFKYQFIIDSSQKKLDIPYKRLTFLNATKRVKLHLIEDDKKLRATEVFIKLYAKETERTDSDFVCFSTAENTFSGYAIPHSQLTEVKNKPDFDNSDYILSEKKHIISSDNQFPKAITSTQKEEFNSWQKKQSGNSDKEYRTNEELRKKIQTLLVSKRNQCTTIKDQLVCDDKIKISARGDLENFFPCPRKWLFKSVLKLHDDTLDTNLMQSYDMGNLNHKILELYLSQFQNRKLPYYDEVSDSFKISENSENKINSPTVDFQVNLSEYIDKAIKAPSDFRDSPLVINALNDQKDKINRAILSFLKFLLQPYSDPNSLSPAKNFGGIGNCTLVGCEKTICVPSEEYDWYGKIDCLLLSPENDWIIVDYKNSKSAAPTKKETVVDSNNLLADFQMPLYFKLIEEEKHHEISAGYFYAIKDIEKIGAVDKFVVSKGAQTATYELYKPTMNALEDYAKVFNSHVNPKNGTMILKPYSSQSKKDKLNVITYENCIKCSFKGICRTTYCVGGKSIERK